MGPYNTGESIPAQIKAQERSRKAKPSGVTALPVGHQRVFYFIKPKKKTGGKVYLVVYMRACAAHVFTWDDVVEYKPVWPSGMWMPSQKRDVKYIQPHTTLRAHLKLVPIEVQVLQPSLT